MSAEFAGLLVTTIIGFLTLLVQNHYAGKKASAERRDAADVLKLQAEQVRADLDQKAQLDADRERRADERAQRDRDWAREDRIAAEKKADRVAREMTVSIDGVSRVARAALAAATNIGAGLEDDAAPPPPNRRVRAGTIADRKPPPVVEPDMDLGARVLFAPGYDDEQGVAATVTGAPR